MIDRVHVHVCACAYVRIYIYTVRSRACSGSSGTTAAGRFKPNHIFCSRTHRRTAGSFPAPARLHAPCAPSHRSRSARPPLRESSRQIDELRVIRLFVCTNCVHVYKYTIERAYVRAYTCSCIRVSLRLLTCINANAVSYVCLRACVCVRVFARR